jgi:demethylmenaquinone methyltransferase/2-methoxy-6-polyprenyl-1,4-benzoquinol methylase
MLDEAAIKQRQSGRYEAVTFQQGDALALPLHDASFDVVTISFGLRNVADRHLALTEMHRILRPGGRLFVLEFSQPYRWFRPLYFFYLRKILPVIAGSVTGDRAAYVYLNETIEQFPGRDAMCAEIRHAGFSQVTAKAMTFGIVALHEAQR